MGSWLMGSFGSLDQIEPDLPVPNYSFTPNVFIYLVQSVIVIIQLF